MTLPLIHRHIHHTRSHGLLPWSGLCSLKRRLSAVEARRRLIAALTDFAIIVAPKERFEVVKADPADNRVLEAAVAGSAGYAVWGDRHLLEMHIRV